MMKLYSPIRRLLFLLEPEKAHAVSLTALKWANRTGLLKWFFRQPFHPLTCMGLSFKNPIGLAAGLDKNGEYCDALAALGFGFIEIGTVTPKPQPGNPKPRLFRLTQSNAIINRMGFNSKGADYVANQLKQRRDFSYRLGINLGKNKETPLEEAVNDYRTGMEKLWPYADYFTINLSSPNTPGLRTLQEPEHLSALLTQLKAKQHDIEKIYHRHIPLLVKLSPDLIKEELSAIAAVCLSLQIDGAILTNTTIDKSSVSSEKQGQEAGGLSGAPLFKKSTEILEQFAHDTENQLPLIGVGGINSSETAKAKFKAGASLIQIYTGFIFEGPGLISQL